MLLETDREDVQNSIGIERDDGVFVIVPNMVVFTLRRLWKSILVFNKTLQNGRN